MTLSGPGETWKTGTWELKLPVSEVFVWTWDGFVVRLVDDWRAVGDNVLSVMVKHPNGYRTWMTHVDEYPDPRGEGRSQMGIQVGELNSKQWADVLAAIREHGAAL